MKITLISPKYNIYANIYSIDLFYFVFFFYIFDKIKEMCFKNTTK